LLLLLFAFVFSFFRFIFLVAERNSHHVSSTIEFHLSLVLNNRPRDSVRVLTGCRCEEPTVQCG
jgi:hypothetical protein